MGFGGLSIAFDHRIIEPRPWTVAQSRWASALIERVPVGPVLEVCCGAGHIGLLAAQGNNREFIQVDVDPVACEYAALNASAAGMAERVSVRCGPMDEVLAAGETFALIIADPPYLPTASVTRFPEDPPIAIDGGQQGFDLIADCLDLINKHLAHEGAAVLQVAHLAQARAVHQHLTMHPELGITQVDQRDCGRGALVQLAHIGSSRPVPPRERPSTESSNC
jgi:release factor glutamine methyltransferase